MDNITHASYRNIQCSLQGKMVVSGRYCSVALVIILPSMINDQAAAAFWKFWYKSSVPATNWIHECQVLVYQNVPKNANKSLIFSENCSYCCLALTLQNSHGFVSKQPFSTSLQDPLFSVHADCLCIGG